jgi:hypothetical protein
MVLMHAIDTASLAAADLFRRDPERLWSETTKELVRLIHSNIIRQDSSGKEYLRIAVSAAIDLAANRISYLSKDVSVPAGNAINDMPEHLFVVKASEWLRFFLGPHISYDRKVKRWAKRRWINFTHLSEIGEEFYQDRPVPRCRLAEAWSRQMALASDIRNSGWNLLIPSIDSEIKPRLDDPVDVARFCPIVIRIVSPEDNTSQIPSHKSLAPSIYSDRERPTGILIVDVCLTEIPKLKKTVKKKTLTGGVRYLTIRTGCDEVTPLWVFRQKAGAGGFTAHREADKLLSDHRFSSRTSFHFHSLGSGVGIKRKRGEFVLLCIVCDGDPGLTSSGAIFFPCFAHQMKRTIGRKNDTRFAFQQHTGRHIGLELYR